MTRFTDERADRTDSENFNAALDLLDGNQVETGGNCTALRFDVGGVYELVIIGQDPNAPESLDEGPVSVAAFDSETDDILEGSTRTYPTLRDYCIDLYGNIEGETLPECLQD